MLSPERRARAVVAAAARLVDPGDPLGARARRLLPASTGLSSEGVELALRDHVERGATDDEWARLVGSVEPAPRVWVSLSANVFVGAVRALALAFAAAPLVSARASRREPVFLSLLAEAMGAGPLAGALSLVDAISPSPPDAVHAYGSDETLRALAASLPPRVALVAHGHGLGLAAVDGSPEDAARAIARDVVPFDQRGCASPRVVLVSGGEARALRVAATLAEALDEAEARVPTGHVSPAERAAVREYLDVSAMAGAALGRVGVALDGAIRVPPLPRVVCVAPAVDVEVQLSLLTRWVTSVAGDGPLADAVAALCPGARRASLGEMQRPPLDGPIDLRGLRGPRPGPTLRDTAWRGSRRSTSRPSRGRARPGRRAPPTETTGARTRTCPTARPARRSLASSRSSSPSRPPCARGTPSRRTACSASQ